MLSVQQLLRRWKWTKLEAQGQSECVYRLIEIASRVLRLQLYPGGGPVYTHRCQQIKPQSLLPSLYAAGLSIARASSASP